MSKVLRYLVFILLPLLLFPFGVSAEEELTWQDCVKEAKIHHPDLVSASERIKELTADKTITQSTVAPQITAEVSGRRSKATSGGGADNYSYSVTGRQLLFDGFKTANQIRAASENIRASEYNYAATSANVRLALRIAFVELLRAQELVAITEEIASRRKQNLELVQMRYNAGREHKGSLLTSRAELAKAELEVIEAKRNLSIAQRELLTQLGRTEFQPIKAKGTLSFSQEGWEKPNLEKIINRHPSLKEVAARKEATRFALKSAQAEFFPEAYFSLSVGRSGSDLFPDEEEWMFGISFSLPLFEGGSRRAKISKTQAQLNQVLAEELSTHNTLLSTLEEAWTELQNAIDNVAVQQKFLEAAQERAKIANAQYSTGLISFDNWTIIEDNLANVKKSFLNAQTDVLLAEARWAYAKGERLEDDQKEE